MFRPRIIHKGIALALIPLAVNTIWIVLLSASLTHAKELVDSEHKQTVVLSHINKITLIIANAFGALASYSTNGNELHRRQYERLNEEAHSEFLILQKLTDDDLLVAPLVKQLDASFGIDEEVLDSLNSSNAKQVEVFQGVKKVRLILRQAGKKNKILMMIMNEKQAQLERIRRSEEVTEAYVRATVIAGLTSNFVLALLLILLFVKDITGRLQLVLENAHFLPLNLPLTRKVSGTDELSELDAEIQTASTKLIEAAEYRRGLMQMMAHDLRSPLTACSLSLDILKEAQVENDPRKKKHLDSMRISLGTSINLIDDLLLLESLEVGQLVLDKAPENIKELIDTSLQTVISLTSRKKIDIINEATTEQVYIDRNRILQVITNLISNAIKFSAVESTIRITTLKRDNEMIVTVIDKGRGLTLDEKVHLFQKFSQTSEGRKAGGTGLGLAISKLIVESHNGKIGVDSEPGAGSSFWFSIPN
ncbi:MAG: HAMP domain-containing histidine kinase [Leptolyngbya sp.]|nr:HAMP domain-containing histidine kinase [Candidatus Melainabacteria bacterium]